VTAGPTRRQSAQADADFQTLVRKTYAGNPGALTALGLRLLAGRDAPHSPVDGEALIAEAARQGEAAAWAYLGTLAAAGVVRLQCWQSAWDALRRAGDIGHAGALHQFELLALAQINSAADIAAWLASPRFRDIHNNPRIAASAGFIEPAWCLHLRTLAKPLLQPAKVYDFRKRQLRLDSMRTNLNAAFSISDTDLVVQLIRARAALAAGVPQDHLEPPEVLNYSQGQQYRLHVDFFHPSLPHFADIIRERGQRTRTLLIYLNEDYIGGETEFPELGVKFRGRRGEALLFENVNASGDGDMRTAHAGTPVTTGHKWLFSQWIRNQRQPVA
jgi:prolyl 4-hydroxylase